MVDLATLLAYQFRDVEQTYDSRDALLYALSIGFGVDPTDPQQLRFVYEQNQQVMPTFATVLGHPGPWYADAGLDVTRIVYSEQTLRLHRPLACSGRVMAREKIVGWQDKGADKGALLQLKRELTCADTGARVATLGATLMCRGDGGTGENFGTPVVPPKVPEREPDKVINLSTLPQSALLYRLNGDRNPLHADPERARQVGFDRPILHGLCSYAMACRAVLELWADHDASRLTDFRARFTAPMYPGETLRVETWEDTGRIAFRAFCRERDTKVLDGGEARLHPLT